MLILRNKLFADKKENSDATTVAGLGAAGAGTIGLAKMDKSELTGRVKRYHATDEKNVNSIKESGLKASKANGETFTKKVLDHIPDEELNNKVYLGKKKSVADAVGRGRKSRGYGKQKVVKVNMDYDEWKKLKKVKNPELLGAKNGEEYIRELMKRGKVQGFGKDFDALDPLTKEVLKTQGKATFETLGEKGTEVIEGDIASKFIKGGKGYEKNSLKKVAKYVKNNPKRFAKGAGKAALGVATVGTGLAVAAKGAKKKD